MEDAELKIQKQLDLFDEGLRFSRGARHALPGWRTLSLFGSIYAKDDSALWGILTNRVSIAKLQVKLRDCRSHLWRALLENRPDIVGIPNKEERRDDLERIY
jgi:hypothetical protein